MRSEYRLRVFRSPHEFAEAVEPYLLEHEADHCLPLGLLPMLLEGRAPKAFMAAVVGEGSAPVLVALQTPPHRLILSRVAEGHATNAVVAPLVAGAPAAPGVVGPKEPSEAYARAWATAAGGEFRLAQAERVYVCTGVVQPAAVPGAMLKAGPEHRELLKSWRLAFMREATPTDPRQSEAGAGEAVDNDLASTAGGLWLWEVDGEPVSMAGARGPTRHGIRIGPVYTPEEQRGHGYASALIAALTQHLLGTGLAHVTLFTDLSNATSNRIYQAIGYRPVIDQDVYDYV